MKRIILMFVVCSVLAVPAMAQSNDQSLVNEALSPEELAQIQRDVRTIARAMGLTVADVKQAEAEQKQQEQTKVGKTMVDVTDRALTMVEGAVAQTAATLERVAPDVWRIMIRQQYARSLTWCLFPWGLLAVFRVYSKRARPKLATWAERYRNVSYSNWEISKSWAMALGPIIPGILQVTCGIWGVLALAFAIRVLVNPEYYAIRDLLRLILDPGVPPA